MSGEYVVVGAVWRHKREHGRRIEITSVDDAYVDVRRNTSRRRQPILITTLIRNYEPWITNAPAARS